MGATRSITVVGDVMLDVFSEGSASRLSPEAPVPILANPEHREVLGGAGNTALNVLTLGHPATLIGVVGADAPGHACSEILKRSGLGDRLVVSETGKTTVKTRYVASGQQIMRLDVETREITDAAHRTLSATATALAGEATCVVISDYQKGAITAQVAADVLRAAASAGVPVVVDSKCRDFSVYRGASVITPNHIEATAATGHDDPERAARALSDATGGDVIVTLGADGMLVLESGTIQRVSSLVREVSDVTGAGDTVTAAIAVALAEGASVFEAARWATAAAAVAVEHHGTYSVRRDEVPTAWNALA